MAEQRSYDQYCPIAYALDLVGDRWTLLILRDLAVHGPRRFGELRRGLVGIPPNLLSARLQLLVAEGILDHDTSNPARPEYLLTEQGRAIQPVLAALVRFGTPRLELDTDDRLPPVNAVHMMLLSHARRPRNTETASYEVVVDGELFHIGLDDQPTGLPRGRVVTDAHTLLALRRGVLRLADAVAGGRIVVDGPADLLDGFVEQYGLG